jgi:tetratricopeptide (TPR) repeat protein
MDEDLAWLEKKKDGKFFTWIHLYDPHTPYEPPEDFAARYPGRPYLGEIAYTDSQLGRLSGYLKSRNLVERTMIVFAADHGESLGEHQESTHGFFVYQGAVHVPLIITTPFPELWGKTVSEVVSLVDVMPTILEMADIPRPSQVQGKSLVPLLFNPDARVDTYAYTETFYPRFHFGWSELQSLQDGRYKLIMAPDPELYDLTEDPKERRNLATAQPAIYRDLKAKADSFIAKRSENAHQIDLQKIDEETREKLAALGYIGSFSDSAKLRGKVLGNPKEKIHVFNELSRAREMGIGGQVEEATSIIKAIIADDPDIIDAYFTLGNIYFKQENFSEAIRYFQECLDRKPDDSMAIINIANARRQMGQYEDAERLLLESIDKGIVDSQFYFILAGIKSAEGQEDEAIQYFEKCIDLNSESSSSHNALAVIFLNRKDFAKAEAHVQAAFESNPKLANVNYNRAQILEEKGDLAAAAEAYQTELELSPKHFRSAFNLSRVMRIMGKADEEEKYLQLTMELNPEFPMSYFYIARIYLNRGERYEEAVELVKKGIDLKPEEKDLPLGYFLLADLYNRLGNEALSREYALKGQEIARTNANARNR